MKLTLSSVLASTAKNAAFINRSIERECIRINALQQSNEKRSQAIADGIRKAIATYAPTLEARGIASRYWTEELYQYLKNKHRAYSLENPPCRRVIRKILKTLPYASTF